MSNIYNFEKYLSKVFKFPDAIMNLKDLRKDPPIDIRNIFMGSLYGSALRIKAISTIETETKEGILKKRVGKISDDSIGYGLDNLTIKSVHKLWNLFSRIAKRAGMLRDNIFDDYVVEIFDGIDTYNSYNSHCKRCSMRIVKTTSGVKVQYYHRTVVLSLSGFDFQIPIGLEMMIKGEDEVSCALRLLRRIVKELGVRFLDIVIGDALYCTPRFFDECEKFKVIPGAVLKRNQEDLLEMSRAMKKIKEPKIKINTDREKADLWDLNDVIWYTGDRDVRVVWADRKIMEKDEKNPDNLIWKDKRRVFAFSKKIDHIPVQTVYNIGIHRWDIDAKMFSDIVKNWNLKHKTLHFERAYENLLSIKFISYMLFMFFFHRHINSRRKRKNKIAGYIEMARVLYRSACVNLKPVFILPD